MRLFVYIYATYYFILEIKYISNDFSSCDDVTFHKESAGEYRKTATPVWKIRGSLNRFEECYRTIA